MVNGLIDSENSENPCYATSQHPQSTMNTETPKPKYGNEFARLIATMQTPAEIEYVAKAVQHRMHVHELLPALFDRLRTLLLTPTPPAPNVPVGDCLQQSSVIYDLRDWLTLKEYATRHGLTSTNVLSNWISRGIIPADCIVEVAAFNGLKLIRNQPYQQGANTARIQ